MNKPALDIWQYQTALSERRMQWAGLNLSLGAPALARRDAFWRGFGLASLAGSLIVGAAAQFEQRSGRRNSGAEDAHTPEGQNRERAHLARLLWLRLGLDAVGLVGGLALAGTQRRRSRFWAGAGGGGALQSAVLFLFDLMHALPLINMEER